jgi:hypothetical protein
MSNRDLLLKIKAAVESVAKKLKKHPADVTKMELMKHSDISDWSLRKVSLIKLRQLYFPKTERDLVIEREASETASYIKTLETKVGEKNLLENYLIAAIDKHIKPLQITTYNPPPRPKHKGKREIVCMLNDVHYGLMVDPEEVGGVNRYDWSIASRRTGYFIQEVCDYKRSKREVTDKVHLIINGDLIQGVIHGLTGRDLDLWVHQMNGAAHILIHAIKALAENFKAVDVHFEIGNHGDIPHRREGGRVSSQTKDNFEAAVLYACSAAFRDTKTVNFFTQRGIYGSVKLPAGRMLYTHGHLLFSKDLGNPGTRVNTRGLSDAVMRFNNGEREKKQEPAKLILLGHTHSHFHFTTPDGIQVYNVPSLSGVDSYAASLGINHNLVAQLVFECTEKYIFGDSRLIHLQTADSREDMEKIIPAYSRELVWKK